MEDTQSKHSIIEYKIDDNKKQKFKKYSSDKEVLKDVNIILKLYSKDIFTKDVEYSELESFQDILKFMDKNKTKGISLRNLIQYIIELKNEFHVLHLFQENNLNSLNDFLKVFISYRDIEKHYSTHTQKLESVFKEFTSVKTKNSKYYKEGFLKSILKAFVESTTGMTLVKTKVLNVIVENKPVKIETYDQENMVCLYLGFLVDENKNTDTEHYYEFIKYLREKQKNGYKFDRFFATKSRLSKLIDKILLSFLFNFDWLVSCVSSASKIKETILSGQNLNNYHFFEYGYLNNFLSDEVSKNYHALALWNIMKKNFKNSLAFERNKWNPADIIIVKNSNKPYLIDDLKNIKEEIEKLSAKNVKFIEKYIDIKSIRKIQKELSNNEKKIVNIISHKINNLFVKFFNNKDLIFVSLKKNTTKNPSVQYVNFFDENKQKNVDKFIKKVSALTTIDELQKFVEIKNINFGKTIEFEFEYTQKIKEDYIFTTTTSSQWFSTTITIDKKNAEARYGSASIRTIDTNIFENLKNELKSLIYLRTKCLKECIVEYNKAKTEKLSLNKMSREIVVSSGTNIPEKNKEYNLNKLSAYFSSRTIFLIDANFRIAKEFLNKLASLTYGETDVLTEFRKKYYKALEAPELNTIKKSKKPQDSETIQKIYGEIQSYEFSYLFNKATKTIKEEIKKILVVEIYTLISSRGLFNMTLKDSKLNMNIAFRGCPFVLVG